MTIHIAQAYMIKSSFDAWETLRNLQKKGIEEARGLIDAVLFDFVNSPENRNKEPKARLYLESFEMMRRRYAEGDPKWEFDAACLFYEKLGRVCLIPMAHTLLSSVWDFLKTEKCLEDFSWWDDQPKPSFVSDKQWAARERVWKALHGTHPFTMEIVNRGTFYVYSPVLRTREIEERFLGIAEKPATLEAAAPLPSTDEETV